MEKQLLSALASPIKALKFCPRAVGVGSDGWMDGVEEGRKEGRRVRICEVETDREASDSPALLASPQRDACRVGLP